MAGSTVAVLGPGPGIGRAGARLLAAAGARVACIDIQEATAAEPAGVGGRRAASVHRADVTDRAQARSAFAAVVAAHGSLDGILNVVGVGVRARPEELTDND
jgi:glucose 1-dehydrogenase/3-oxoacyl-[acyl-carrier protein] reductase